MISVNNVYLIIDGKPAPLEQVPKSEFAVNINKGDKYQTGNSTLLVLEKLWHLLPGSDKADIKLTTALVED